MPMLLIAEAGLPEEAYAEIADKMTPLIREAKGLSAILAAPDPAGGWRVVEIWESEEDDRDWFDQAIEPTCHQASCRSAPFTRFAPRSPSRRSPSVPVASGTAAATASQWCVY